MKKYISIFFLLFVITRVEAQVAIGKDVITNTDVSLEFGNVSGDANKQRGLILPYVSSQADVISPIGGSLIFDSSDKKVKFYKDDTASWVDLSLHDQGVVDLTYQTPFLANESLIAKTSIGSLTSKDGILVLEDANKAMILPLVDKYISIVNPSAGMIVYDTTNNLVCFFNGTVWTFWSI